MKFLLGLCLVICFVGAHCEDLAPKIKNAKSTRLNKAECIAETKVDEKTLEVVFQNNAVIDTREMQCYLACMMKKEGMMNADGTLSKQFLEDRRTKGCRELGGNDACEFAYRTINCAIRSGFP